MLKVEKTETYGWEAAIRGMRNPKNSWDSSDSGYSRATGFSEYKVGEKDFKLMKQLASAGDDHGKFMRMITVYMDITAPLYWWKEFDTYKVGTVADSCSTMHKIAAKRFELDDFSYEWLYYDNIECLENTIAKLNEYRDKFNKTKDKNHWWQMIQLLPSSYNQKRTVQVNYQVLKHMYHARKSHKLEEWHTFCDWIKKLPHCELIIGEEDVVS